MSRWALVTVPIGAGLLIGAGWAATQVLAAPSSPDLGPSIVITPTPSPSGSTTPPLLEEVTAVTPPPPPTAGDDDGDLDDGDGDLDERDDSEDDPDDDG